MPQQFPALVTPSRNNHTEYPLLLSCLLSQARPLKLSDHLFDAMHPTIAFFFEDALAPNLLNHLENRITSHGSWEVARPHREGAA